ncbi:MAG: lipid A biosynthesis lauroyl acyltransferase [Gammaproteobacteria bacterium]|nr:lipid A biosynthesis lauroyl acyltransferase [Gammaproteobacteria bacterium]
MRPSERLSFSRYWTPRYWAAWFAVGLLRLVVMLPHQRRLAIGFLLGRLGHRIARTRRAVTRRNIALCFPELSETERDSMALKHFEALGASLIEMAVARWGSEEELLSLTQVDGAEHIENAARDGQGIILLSAHFSSLEISGCALSKVCPPFDVVYRRFRNSLFTDLLRTTRQRSARNAIEKNDIKSMVRSLRNGIPVWYAPDQSYNRKQSALLPFFGVPSMTNTATGTLAKLGRAAAVPFFPRRLDDGTYVLTILPALDDFPSGDLERDTMKYVEVLETEIRKAPEQYYWVHRKFKNRPDDMEDAYADLDTLK